MIFAGENTQNDMKNNSNTNNLKNADAEKDNDESNSQYDDSEMRDISE